MLFASSAFVCLLVHFASVSFPRSLSLQITAKSELVCARACHPNVQLDHWMTTARQDTTNSPPTLTGPMGFSPGYMLTRLLSVSRLRSNPIVCLFMQFNSAFDHLRFNWIQGLLFVCHSSTSHPTTFLLVLLCIRCLVQSYKLSAARGLKLTSVGEEAQASDVVAF